MKVRDLLTARQHRGENPPAGTPSQQDTFLTKHVPGAALEVFPWQGLLIKSKVLDMSVWVVRTRQDGEDLAKETGHPGLLLDDVLRQKGRSPQEARAALLPLLISPGSMQ